MGQSIQQIGKQNQWLQKSSVCQVFPELKKNLFIHILDISNRDEWTITGERESLSWRIDEMYLIQHPEMCEIHTWYSEYRIPAAFRFSWVEFDKTLINVCIENFQKNLYCIWHLQHGISTILVQVIASTDFKRFIYMDCFLGMKLVQWHHNAKVKGYHHKMQATTMHNTQGSWLMQFRWTLTMNFPRDGSWNIQTTRRWSKRSTLTIQEPINIWKQHNQTEQLNQHQDSEPLESMGTSSHWEWVTLQSTDSKLYHTHDIQEC